MDDLAFEGAPMQERLTDVSQFVERSRIEESTGDIVPIARRSRRFDVEDCASHERPGSR